MARRIPTHTSLALICTSVAIALATGCASPTPHARAAAPLFAQATPSQTPESWATVLPSPGVEQTTLAMDRRDQALGLPPTGYARVAGAWQAKDRPSVTNYVWVHVPRNDRSLLFFTPRAQHERRAPRVPRRAHPWHTAW